MWRSSSPGVPSFAILPLALSTLPAGILRIIDLKQLYLKFIAKHYSYCMYEIRAKPAMADSTILKNHYSGLFENCL
jgi:hypothetical protein